MRKLTLKRVCITCPKSHCWSGEINRTLESASRPHGLNHHFIHTLQVYLISHQPYTLNQPKIQLRLLKSFLYTSVFTTQAARQAPHLAHILSSSLSSSTSAESLEFVVSSFVYFFTPSPPSWSHCHPHVQSFMMSCLTSCNYSLICFPISPFLLYF